MAAAERYRIGVDVGGTNTDAVLLSLSPIEVVASFKTPTTLDVTSGIATAIQAVISRSTIALADIGCVIIGTTHFVNAVVQRSRRLHRVAVLRLSGGTAFGSRCPPFVDFPDDLTALLHARTVFCQGGFQIDGSEISPLDEAEIAGVAEELARDGITDVVVASIYSPVDASHEERVERILLSAAAKAGRPPPRVTLSHTVSSLGFLARENAAILNASLRPLAEHTIRGFQRAMRTIFKDAACPLYLTQNDGSILTAHEAVKLPIRTFNSGPTNSIRGGAFLWRAAAALAKKQGLVNGTAPETVAAEEPNEALVVVDIGGTTSDAGLLLPNGLPRMSSVASYVAGVKTNFGLPAVESVGLGGGSIVRELEDGTVTVGPDSVGFEIQKKARIFRGSVLTATDIATAASQRVATKDSPGLIVGDPELVADVSDATIQGAKQCMRDIIINLVDRAKIEKGDIAVLVVGGGAILVDTDESLAGISKCRTVNGGDVANAVGAAISKVEGTADMVVDVSHATMAQATEDVKKAALEIAASKGAEKSTISIAEITILPVQYMQSKTRIVVRAIGELDIARSAAQTPNGIESIDDEPEESEDTGAAGAPPPKQSANLGASVDLETYRPQIEGNEWVISLIDLDFISIGCKILGCGGGGDPYVEYLKTKTVLERDPGSVKVIDPKILTESHTIGWSGNMGSPEVSAERMEGNECYQAQIALMKFLGLEKVDAMLALEIGGSNGLVNLGVGAALGVPVVDADYMGRAYPTFWQTTANVADPTARGLNLVPSALASGDGTFMFMTASKTDKLTDKALRAAVVEMGYRAGKAAKPHTGTQVQAWAVTNTISLAWRIGRAVRMEKTISILADRIIEQVGGHSSAKKVFEGKITGVERTLKTGHTYGILRIEGGLPGGKAGTCTIPFKNENAFVEYHDGTGASEVLVAVPDLIAVLDEETGQGLTVAEYKYGLKVIVICIAASPRWTESARGLEIGGPGSMGFDEVQYKPVGVYSQPRSVLEEFGKQI